MFQNESKLSSTIQKFLQFSQIFGDNVCMSAPFSMSGCPDISHKVIINRVPRHILKTWNFEKNKNIYQNASLKKEFYVFPLLFWILDQCSRIEYYLFNHSKLQKSTFNKILEKRPSSDSEAATMYKLKGKSSNMQTGQGFK